jgi:hypothetical protein
MCSIPEWPSKSKKVTNHINHGYHRFQATLTTSTRQERHQVESGRDRLCPNGLAYGQSLTYGLVRQWP